MSRRPLFSTYSQGENRVTGSMIAVFQRLDLSTLEKILEAVTEESSLQLVSFDIVRPEGAGTVPDARIAASFKYLFEVKTAYDALRSDQIAGHLKKLDGSHSDERLFVLTPDAEEPAIVASAGDPRIRWTSFAALNDGINGALLDETVADNERFLLRELQVLLSQEGLLGREDTVVVAARYAYDFYLRHSAYICQSGRAFRRGLTRMGFYRHRKIEPHLPAILPPIHDAVPFTHDHATRLRSTNDPTDSRLAELIEETIMSGERIDGYAYQVFLLSSPDSHQTCRLPQAILHDSEGVAWTMGQRYSHYDRLRQGPRTTAELARMAT